MNKKYKKIKSVARITGKAALKAGRAIGRAVNSKGFQGWARRMSEPNPVFDTDFGVSGDLGL